MGFVRPSALCSTAESELKARPVALTPIRSRRASGPCRSHTRANTKGFATLMIVNPTSASPIEKTRPVAPTTLIPKRSGATRASAG